MALIGDAKQAMGEEKCGQVETRLTGLVATALVIHSMILLRSPGSMINPCLIAMHLEIADQYRVKCVVYTYTYSIPIPSNITLGVPDKAHAVI